MLMLIRQCLHSGLQNGSNNLKRLKYYHCSRQPCMHYHNIYDEQLLGSYSYNALWECKLGLKTRLIEMFSVISQ